MWAYRRVSWLMVCGECSGLHSSLKQTIAPTGRREYGGDMRSLGGIIGSKLAFKARDLGLIPARDTIFPCSLHPHFIQTSFTIQCYTALKFQCFTVVAIINVMFPATT